MRGWNKGGMNSARDFGWMIQKLEHVLPKKRDNKADVPFHNGPLRWPGLNGGPFYDERQIKITFQHEGAHHEGHAADPSYFINWLMAHSDEPMSDDWDWGWLYYGECFDVTWNQEMTISTVEAVLTCEPLKQRRWLTDAIPEEYFDERMDTRTETIPLSSAWRKRSSTTKGLQRYRWTNTGLQDAADGIWSYPMIRIMHRAPPRVSGTIRTTSCIR